MQNLHKVKPASRLDTEEILHFSLPGLLPEALIPGEHIFVMHMTLGTFSLLACQRGNAKMLAEQHLSTAEVNALLPILEAYPYFCPYEVVLASLLYHSVTETTVASCRHRLQEARANGLLVQEMHPIRKVLASVRFKLRTFNLDISSLYRFGYILSGIDTTGKCAEGEYRHKPSPMDILEA